MPCGDPPRQRQGGVDRPHDLTVGTFAGAPGAPLALPDRPPRGPGRWREEASLAVSRAPGCCRIAPLWRFPRRSWAGGPPAPAPCTAGSPVRPALCPAPPPGHPGPKRRGRGRAGRRGRSARRAEVQADPDGPGARPPAAAGPRRSCALPSSCAAHSCGPARRQRPGQRPCPAPLAPARRLRAPPAASRATGAPAGGFRTSAPGCPRLGTPPPAPATGRRPGPSQNRGRPAWGRRRSAEPARTMRRGPARTCPPPSTASARPGPG